MSTVCPKCMAKSADGERVCGKCGALLLTRAQRRDISRGLSNSDPSGAEVGSRGSRGASTATQVRSNGKDDIVLNSKYDADALLKRALEDLGGKRREGPKLPQSRVWLATIGITLGAALVVGLIFVFTGGSAPKHVATGKTTATTSGVDQIFEFNGTGTSSTAPFTTTGPFTFDYRVDCTSLLKAPATFELMQDGKSKGLVSSLSGADQESGFQPRFGSSGSFSLMVTAPKTCTWVVSGSST